jgi:hypothetical protein
MAPTGLMMHQAPPFVRAAENIGGDQDVSLQFLGAHHKRKIAVQAGLGVGAANIDAVGAVEYRLPALDDAGPADNCRRTGMNG